MYLGAEPRVVRGRLSAGRRGTAETLAIMRRLADQGAKEITVREAAVRAIQAAGVRGHDFAGELAAVFRFVRDRIRFTRDPIGTEWLQAPAYTLSRGVGDCDDKATLLVAMLKSIGAPAALRFKVIGETPAGFSHVYVEAAAGGRRIPMDPTRAGTPFGWELPNPAIVGGARA
jgi:transglutaminase-like putative cysteine protease